MLNKKLFLLPLALALAVLSNMSVCCEASVEGEALPGLYSPDALGCAVSAARAAAEEIAVGEAALAAPELRCHLSFAAPDGDAATLCGVLLETSDDVMLTYGVYVDGERLGNTESEAALRARLERFIEGQKPSWAVRGEISGEVEVRREYTRRGYVATTDDMALLISGAAPVLYFNEEGYVSRA